MNKELNIKYSTSTDNFYRELERQVQSYFKTNGLNRHRHPEMHLKLISMFLICIALYAIMLGTTLHWAALLLVIISFHAVLFQLALIAHDGSHYGASPNPKINKIIYCIFDLVGVNSYLWEFDHVQAHHQLPNISGYDSNMYMYPLIRLDPHAPKKTFHRFQHIYALLIYAHTTILKVFLGDFFNFRRDKIGTIYIEKHPLKEWLYLFVTKFVAISYIYVIPILFINAPVSQIILFIYIGHVISGVALGMIFQVTHTNMFVIQDIPSADGKISNSYEKHVLKATADFSIENKAIMWLTGGLNIHAVHHLFPDINQMHLPAIAKIVRKTAKEHNIAYIEFPSWWAAIKSHFQALKKLGTASV